MSSPLNTRVIEHLSKLEDKLDTLSHNLTGLNIIHENLINFNESCSSLLYGMMCNSWCVDFKLVSPIEGPDSKTDQQNVDNTKIIEYLNEINTLDEKISKMQQQIDELEKQQTADTTVGTVTNKNSFVKPTHLPVYNNNNVPNRTSHNTKRKINTNSVVSSNNISRNKFRRVVPTPEIYKHDNNNNINTPEYDTDTSFVSNPEMVQNASVSASNNTLIRNPSNVEYKRRRKSTILNTIRQNRNQLNNNYKSLNQETPTSMRVISDNGGNEVGVKNTNNENRRMSLAIGASRLTKHNGKRIGNNSSTVGNINKGKMHNRFTNNDKNRTTIGERPPFR
ncbi:uncharacterized protein SCODWIG_03769 [Saccharomycodes ludwigii]|uniref:DASH complex subunit DAM1 n=1 Tax=Saccharomycodes ludwigii TaxID=36035 RepID=A0A376BBK4_9ASCO|nr:hypothetical protein SCDLUD_005204 [Saccharomycodes ludwigii]KAH3898865.1 hypothetical protein SCDLUD_005204 [Saccharomycodes ludwigii]SSD62007.1 uncharacterized protein SCODWIG_03769 [Saccharomycodes ludwigii]